MDVTQAVKRAMFKFQCVLMICSLCGLSGCRKSSDTLKGKPLNEVLLRYTPQVGKNNEYKYFMSLDKKFYNQGKWKSEGNERLDGVLSIKTIEQNGSDYSTKFDIKTGNSNLNKEKMDIMEDKAEAAMAMDVNISDRYVFDKYGTDNLCFPDQPISPGTEWEGERIFYSGDLATVNPPALRMSYRLTQAVENKDGRFCVIESKPLTTKVECLLQIGQLGIKCDAAGKVTAIRQDSDAQGKIKVGDILVAVNGQKAVTSGEWNILYERYIERPDNAGSNIVLTVRRDEWMQDINVRKSFVTLGTVEITIKDALRKVIFDITKGIIISDESSSEFSFIYNFLDEFPFVDNFAGFVPFKDRAKTKAGPRVYNDQTRMKLL